MAREDRGRRLPPYSSTRDLRWGRGEGEIAGLETALMANASVEIGRGAEGGFVGRKGFGALAVRVELSSGTSSLA